MGSTYRFTCNECQKTIECSGGKDGGRTPFQGTNTMICQECLLVADYSMYEEPMKICNKCKGNNIIKLYPYGATLKEVYKNAKLDTQDFLRYCWKVISGQYYTEYYYHCNDCEMLTTISLITYTEKKLKCRKCDSKDLKVWDLKCPTCKIPMVKGKRTKLWD